MKAATGELNLTVITIVAIAAIIGFFTLFFNGPIKKAINDQWDKISTSSDKIDTSVASEE